MSACHGCCVFVDLYFLRTKIKIALMSYFKAKMHQNQFFLGLRPRPRWGAYSAPPDPLAGFKGAYF